MVYWLRRCVRFGWPMVVIMIVVSAVLIGFWVLAADVLASQSLSFDQAILNWLFAMRGPLLTSAMIALTTSGSVYFVGPALALATALWWRRDRPDVYALWVTVGLGFVLNEVLKTIFARPRPNLHPWLGSASGWSFPSGHSTTALVFFGIMAYLLARRLPGAWRALVWALAVIWILLVGLSRNYIGVHYPSDVLAAYAVTLPILIGVISFHRCACSPEHPLPPAALPPEAGHAPGSAA